MLLVMNSIRLWVDSSGTMVGLCATIKSQHTMFRRSKLKLLRKLAPYAARTPVQAQLDRLWGFKPEALKPKKRRRAACPKRLYDKHGDIQSKVDKAFASVARVVEQQDSGPTVPAEGTAEVKGNNRHRNFWEPDPEVEHQKRIFKDTVKDLHSLVYPHLDPIAKRHYDNAKLTALGGKVAKNRKMPYNEFMQRSRALKRNVEKNKELEKQLGVKLFMDTKGGARFADIEKRRRKKEFKDSKSPLDFGGKNGVYYIKPNKRQ